MEAHGAEVVGLAVAVYQPNPTIADFGNLPIFYLAKMDCNCITKTGLRATFASAAFRPKRSGPEPEANGEKSRSEKHILSRGFSSGECALFSSVYSFAVVPCWR